MRILKVALFIFCLVLVFLLYYALNTSNPAAALTKADAIVLLSGNYKERAPAAGELIRNGYADRIILTNDGVFSSWSQKYGRNLYQIEWAEEELVSLGVQREQIVKLPELVTSTMSEAQLTNRYAREKGLKKIIIVTSDYHIRRALWAFRNAFEGYPVQLMVSPALSSASGIKNGVVELWKLIYYQLKYGLPWTAAKN